MHLLFSAKKNFSCFSLALLALCTTSQAQQARVQEPSEEVIRRAVNCRFIKHLPEGLPNAAKEVMYKNEQCEDALDVVANIAKTISESFLEDYNSVVSGALGSDIVSPYLQEQEEDVPQNVVDFFESHINNWHLAKRLIEDEEKQSKLPTSPGPFYTAVLCSLVIDVVDMNTALDSELQGNYPGQFLLQTKAFDVFRKQYSCIDGRKYQEYDAIKSATENMIFKTKKIIESKKN
ncbi:MAG: hypothetical protein KDK51_08400 [Deltaproteobacteria bacterium]|nr:hypothetical protein [Deltaproteobacteria bacterium]